MSTSKRHRQSSEGEAGPTLKKCTGRSGLSDHSGLSDRPGHSGLSDRPGRSGLSDHSGLSDRPGHSGLSDRPGRSGLSDHSGLSDRPGRSGLSDRPGLSGLSDRTGSGLSGLSVCTASNRTGSDRTGLSDRTGTGSDRTGSDCTGLSESTGSDRTGHGGATVAIRQCSIPVTRMPVITCLFFGKRGLVLPLALRKGHSAASASIPCEDVVCPALLSELEDVQSCLSTLQEDNKVCVLSSGLHVHVYRNTRTCSSMSLAVACEFFHFDNRSASVVDMSAVSAIDVMPYIYSNSSLLYLNSSNTEVAEVVRERRVSGRYAWSSAPGIAWNWNEDVWTERLFHCITDALSDTLQAIPVYCWPSTTYKARVGSLFPNVLSLPIAPFQGMTDILLLGKHGTAVVNVSEECVVSIEVEMSKGPTFPVSVASRMRDWPQKIGELLASMYYFSTCNYLNSLRTLPGAIQWTGYGILTIRSVGYIALRMVLDCTGCHVHLIHEGCPLSLGSCLRYISRQVSNEHC